jgi:hypothetical protein
VIFREIILEALQKSDCATGKLKDICHCDYPTLFSEIAKLVSEGEIEHFMAGDPVVLRYRLKQFRPASTWKLLPRQQFHEGVQQIRKLS